MRFAVKERFSMCPASLGGAGRPGGLPTRARMGIATPGRVFKQPST